MADVKWIKIVTDIFDDEKILLIEQLPESDSIIVIWFKLLCLAGKQNNRGVFMINDKIPYTDEMLSAIFRRKLETVRSAIRVFEHFGMVEVVNGVITIPNWGRHQSLDQLEQRREYMRTYMQEYRQKQLCKTNSRTNSKANVNSLDKNKIREDKDKNKKRVSKDTPKESGGERLVDAFEKYANGNKNIIQAFKDFEEMRKKIRKPLTDKAKELIVKELKKLAKDDETLTLAILNQSIRNSWQDVFPLRQSQEQDKPGKALNKPKSQREYTADEMNELFDDMEDLRC